MTPSADQPQQPERVALIREIGTALAALLVAIHDLDANKARSGEPDDESRTRP
jgi:hypothetical protein